MQPLPQPMQAFFYMRPENTSQSGAHLPVLYATCLLHTCRNAGHHRLVGLSDHHILHYVVTAACLLQISNLFALARRNAY